MNNPVITPASSLPGPFLSKNWMGSCNSYQEAEWVLVGLPYDGTTSYRPGTRFAPSAIRAASWGIETYSPLQQKDLETLNYYDMGDLDFPIGNRDGILHQIYENTVAVLKHQKKWFGIGGEHLVSLPAFQAYVERYPEIGILHFDAHADLREDFLGEKLSHATVLRRMVELISPDRFVQIGIRSGPQEEFDWMKQHGTLVSHVSQLPEARARLENRPVFLTIDLDVLDPSILCGTGTPEPGGQTFNELIGWLQAFSGLNVVGADVVELSPPYDASGVSNVVAAKVIREALLAFS
jgi:agmatinase